MEIKEPFWLEFGLNPHFGSNGVTRRFGKIVPKNYDEEYYTFDPYANGENEVHYGKGPVYHQKKKFPRFFGPFPFFGFQIRDPIRPFPANTLLILTSSLLIPFTPFGVFEIRLPTGLFLNYFVERLNG